MTKQPELHLSRRERQIMDILYQHGRATTAEVLRGLPNAPSYSAVRAMLRILEEKSHVKHEEESLRYVYLPTVPRAKAKRSALKHVLRTFFDGSVEQVAVALLDGSTAKLTNAELARLEQMIKQARKKGASS